MSDIFEKAITDPTLQEGFYADPYTTYNQLQSVDPIHWSDLFQSWVITDYADIASILLDPRFISKRESRQVNMLPDHERGQFADLKGFYELWPMYLDGKDHVKIRKAIGNAFSPTKIAEYGDDIDAIVQNVIRSFDGHDTINIPDEYAVPIASAAVLHVMGIPFEDHEMIKACAENIVGFLVERIKGVPGAKAAQESYHTLALYIDKMLAEQETTADTKSLFYLLLQAEQTGTLNRDEVIAVFANLLVDGYEPIANTISAGIHYLLTHLDLLQMVKEKTISMDSLIEELLRQETAFQYITRRVGEDTEYKGRTMHKGDRLMLMLAAANTDPKQFTSHGGETTKGSHLAFGKGSHYCVGAALTRSILKAGLSSFIEHFPEMQLNGKSEWGTIPGLRVLKKLDIKIN